VGENDASYDRPVTGPSVRRGAQYLSGCKRSLNYMLHNQRLSFRRTGGDPMTCYFLIWSSIRCIALIIR